MGHATDPVELCCMADPLEGENFEAARPAIEK
jgi:hypothetical protein